MHIELIWCKYSLRKGKIDFCTLGKPKLVPQKNKDLNRIDTFDQVSNKYVHKNVKWCHLLWYVVIETAYIKATGKRVSAVTYHCAETEGLRNIMMSEPAKKEGTLTICCPKLS